MNGQRAGIIALALTTSFYLFEFVTRIEPSLAIESIATDFNLSHGSVGTLSSIFFWVYAPMQLVVGVLLDRFGARPLIVPAIATCALGVILFAWGNDPVIAGAGRILTGFGASFAFVGALYVVNHSFAPKQFAVLSGLVNTIGMLGTAVGANLLADAIQIYGWRPVFDTTGIVGLVLFLMAFLFLRAGPKSTISQPSGHITSAFSELSGILTSPRIWIISAAGALYYMPINVFGGLWGQSDLVQDHGLEPVSAEMAVSMIYFGMAVGSVGAGALSDWLGHRKWIIASSAALSAVAYTFAIYSETSSVALIASALFVAGLLGGAQMLTYAMAKEGRSAAEVGKVISFVNMIGIASAIFFQPLIGWMIDMTGGDYHKALSSVPACAIAAALLILLVKEWRHPDHR
ncbi:MFS transporter [Rhodobacteraceae bacterium KMM 6894]|nr:MFS transporter [Rhodobacteraceae bacterium KMM 6894]